MINQDLVTHRYDSCHNIVVLTASGGSGHLRSAILIVKTIKELGRNIKCTTLDVLKSKCTFDPRIGQMCAEMWNRAQKEGSVAKQMSLVKKQPLSSFIFYLPTYSSILKEIQTPDKHGLLPDRIVATSPMFLSAICAAVEKENFRRKEHNIKEITIDLHVMEPPTDGAVYYFESLKNLSGTQAKLITLYSLDPSDQELQKYSVATKEEYWQKKSGHLFEVVTFASVDEDFKNCQTALPGPKEERTVVLKAQNPDELAFCASNPRGVELGENNTFITHIKAEDRVGLVMLGGVPTESAILGYVSEAIEIADRVPQDKKCFLFVACGPADDNTLYPKVIEQVAVYNRSLAAKNSGLYIIPFTGQPAKYIFAASDFSITRSGGITVQELRSLKEAEKQNSKSVFVHSQLESPNSSFEKRELAQKEPNELAYILLAKKILDGRISIELATQETLENIYENYLQKGGMPLWEADNAQYLTETVQARSITHHHIGHIILNGAPSSEPAKPLLAFNPNLLLRRISMEEDERSQKASCSGCICMPPRHVYSSSSLNGDSTSSGEVTPTYSSDEDSNTDSGIGSSLPSSDETTPV